MLRRLALSLALVASATVLGAGCPGSSAPPELEGAYTQGIPVYAPSEIVPHDIGGFYTGADMSGAYHGWIWHLRTSDPFEKVVAFYEKAAPPDSRHDEGDNPNRRSWFWLPAGLGEGEYLEVTVDRKGDGTDIKITEVVGRSKHGKDEW